MGAGHWAESRTACEQAIACAARAGARPEESRARSMLGSDLVALGLVDPGIAQLREASRIADETGPAEMIIVCRHNLALNLVQADHLGEALGEVRAALDIARTHGLERRFGLDLSALLADVELRLGRWDDADGTIRQALALDPGGEGTPYLAVVAARLAALRGDAAAARRRLDALDPSSLEPDLAAFATAVRAELALTTGDADAATAAVGGGLARLAGLDDVLWAAPLVALGLRAAAERAEHFRAARDGDGLARAQPAADVLAARIDPLEARAATGTTRAWLALARAEETRRAGNPEPEAWLVAASAWDAVPEPFPAAYARFRAAEAELRRHGIRGAASEPLREAHAIATELRAAPFLAEIVALAGRARISLPAAEVGDEPAATAAATVGAPSAGAGPGETGSTGAAGGPEEAGAQPRRPAGTRPAGAELGLSPREIEVLSLVAEGLSNGEIAERLFITRKTAAVHVTHILDKLGVSNRVEAAMVAARVGLASDPRER
jgi:DNA-binding CsgD family transcriptional regulator